MKTMAAFVVLRPRWIWAAVLALSLSIGWLAAAIDESLRVRQRQLLLDQVAERTGTELMGETQNSKLMGLVSLLGLVNEDVKAVAQDLEPGRAPAMLAKLENMARAYDANGVAVVGADGVVRSAWEDGQSLKGAVVASRPYFQAAKQGAENIYATAAHAQGVRSLHFAAPVFAQGMQDGDVIGVVVARTTVAKLEGILKSTADIAVLLSPQGVVFASSEPDWLGRATSAISPEQWQTIRATGQFGQQFDAQAPEVLPVNLTRGANSHGGRNYVTAHTALNWNDPFGDWRLVLMEDYARTVPRSTSIAVGLGAGLVFVLVASLSIAMLRGLHERRATMRQLHEVANQQRRMAQQKSQMAAIAVRLQQCSAPMELAQAFLTHARESMGAMQGTVYALDPSGAPPLCLLATAASAEAPPLTLELGEGLLGQCAQERQMQVIRAPQGDFWTLHSGLGYGRPAVLMMAPILLKGGLIGVVELALSEVPGDDTCAQFQEMVGLLAINLEILRRSAPTDSDPAAATEPDAEHQFSGA